ncbi:cupin domain-containing protein [Kytococcus sedentarius]|uniref:cupin domain-containing protein n=1 Tax=Kytococcus sedentarius TaxID=1276 RepID=UPI00384C2285
MSPSAPTSEQSPVVTSVVSDHPIEPGKVRATTLVDDDAVRTVCFAIDAGEGLTEHKAPHRIVITVVAGAMEFTVGDETHAMVPGDVVNLAASVPHAVAATEPCHFLLTMVKSA